jgi:hypothetical protein
MAGVVRKEVLNALDEAQARGDTRVRVIVGLRGPESLGPVKEAIAHLGVKTVLRETESFLVARLTRAQIERVSRLADHVKAIWLDQPVTAGNSHSQ